jgi:acetylornithine deacetylase/succinyl-diaminopimelate desuccinylase-like protein/FtsP/CotA-like multicopper oxidase with cupredoxin domain
MLNNKSESATSDAAAFDPPKVVSLLAINGHADAEVLALAASVSGRFASPLAQAVIESAHERGIQTRLVEHLRRHTAAGIVADVDGRCVVLGSETLFEELSMSLDALGEWPQRLRRRGETVLFVAVDGQTAGLVGLASLTSQPIHHTESDMSDAMSTDQFSTETTGLPMVRPVEAIDLTDGDQFELRMAPVTKRIGDAQVRLLAYNGSIPGPTLRVHQGSEVLVRVVNEGDLETTVHWHGLRLENKYDGTRATQNPIPVGGVFTYRLSFPDPGIYWYHPHIREDYGQELGLYGNIVVLPSERDYWSPAHRELAVTLDDILVEDGHVAPFSRVHPTYSAMGRFGNVMLVNGEPELSLDARQGEVVRLYFTNTANTRVFNVGVRGARMKLVGGDSGRVEREAFMDSVVLAPSERAVVDVLFDRAREATLEHRTPGRTYRLGTIKVATEPALPDLTNSFGRLRVDDSLVALRGALAPHRLAEPDKTLALVAEMDMGGTTEDAGAPTRYTCPMHPDVVRTEPGRCPKCRMKLLPSQYVQRLGHGTAHASPTPMRPHVDATDHGNDHSDEATGIEWEDGMVDVNRITTPANMRWKLIDRQTGKVGGAIDWRFRVGQHVKIRIVNEMDSDHPMHHPFHVHGAGRFLVLARNGREDTNLVWKDTVLVRTGETVDILLHVTHPGVWMAHCHIAEHHESGMMLHFHVDPEASRKHSIMKTLLLMLAGGLLSLSAFTVAVTARHQPEPHSADVVPDAPVPAGAADRLAGAIRARTLSSEQPAEFDPTAFRTLHDHLRSAFPRVHAHLRREEVGTYSLLYEWPGTNPALKPILLSGHLDVVPVESGTEREWQHQPFAGDIADGFIWGRGAIDNKSAVMGTLEAIEMLLAEGVQPVRTVYVAFGHDEEVGGTAGAARIAALLTTRGVQLEMVLDEGGVIADGVLPGVSRPVALVGVAEKGFVTIELSTRTPGGHSSLPPRHTAVGILSAAVARLEQTPMPPRLEGATRELFERTASQLPILTRAVLANLWLTAPFVLRQLEASPTTNAMIRTTAAPTILQAGTKDNVLPSTARAVVNFRILQGDSVDGRLEHVRDAIDDTRVAVRVAGRFSAEPSAVSPIASPSFRTLERSIGRTFPDTLVAPYLVVVATDARHYAALSSNVFRFLPVRVTAADLDRMHGPNERIGIAEYESAIRAYRQLLLDAAGG